MPQPLSAFERAELLKTAQEAANHAYAPYSNFRVGAAVLGRDTHVGANIENASYGATICAERVAMANAVLADDRNLRAIAIATPDRPSGGSVNEALPCGTCRQWLAELAPQIEVIISEDESGYQLKELLPFPFALRKSP
jgi:cytidine deaminase